MVAFCSTCGRQCRQIDASVYGGDYRNDGPYAYGRQCVECGSVFEVQAVGKSAHISYRTKAWIPPRSKWEEPKR